MKTKHLRLMQRAYVILFFCFMYLPIAYMIVFRDVYTRQAPTGGEVKVAGFSLPEQAQQAKACVGYLPEQPPLYPEMTVREYLDFAAELKGVKKAQRREQVQQAARRTGLDQMCIRDRILSGSVMPVASTYKATRTLYSSAMPSLENTSCGTGMVSPLSSFKRYNKNLPIHLLLP